MRRILRVAFAVVSLAVLLELAILLLRGFAPCVDPFGSTEILYDDSERVFWRVDECFAVVGFTEQDDMRPYAQFGLDAMKQMRAAPNIPLPAWGSGDRETVQLLHEFIGGDANAEFAYGWPLVCVRCRIWAHTEPLQYGWSPSAVVAGSMPKMLWPYDVLWQRLLINLAMLSVGMFVVWNISNGVFRRVRANKGLCQRCGYDLSGIDACPECGA